MSEIRLWRAVIEQAIEDASRDVSAISDLDVRNAAIRDRDEARVWLTRNSRDFRDVCAYADLDADAVLERSLMLMARNWERPGGLRRAA